MVVVKTRAAFPFSPVYVFIQATGIIFLSLFGGLSAFILSFQMLVDVAESSGFHGSNAYIWPLLLDAFSFASALSVLLCKLQRRRAIFSRLLVLVFGAISVGYNLFHPEISALPMADIVVYSAHSLPPLVWFLAIELLSSHLTPLVQELDAVSRRASKNTDRGAFESTPETAQRATEAHIESAELSKAEAIDAMLEAWKANPDASYADLETVTDRKRSTLYAYRRELNDAGRIRISENGGGVEVLDVA